MGSVKGLLGFLLKVLYCMTKCSQDMIWFLSY